MIDKKKRVAIWNSFLEFAWNEAKVLSGISKGGRSSRSLILKGGTLPDEKFHTLSLLVLCNLAIEARVNHLIHELREKGKISKKVAEAAQRLRTEEKWFLLPALAKISKEISSSHMPHQAISQICSYRNNLVHVKYENLESTLPTTKNMLNLYNNFVRAMENMNVILKGIRKERKTVLKKLIV